MKIIVNKGFAIEIGGRMIMPGPSTIEIADTQSNLTEVEIYSTKGYLTIVGSRKAETVTVISKDIEVVDTETSQNASNSCSEFLVAKDRFCQMKASSFGDDGKPYCMSHIAKHKS